MATKSNVQRSRENRKKWEEARIKATSSPLHSGRDAEGRTLAPTIDIGSSGNVERSRRNRLANTINFSTLESDFNSLISTLDTVHSGWQNKETMNNTRNSLQSMYDRMGKYQEYQKQYGGPDFTDVYNALGDELAGWDDFSWHYAEHKNADSYNKAMKDAKAYAEKREGMKTADLNAVQKEIDDLQGILNTANDYKNELETIGSQLSMASGRSIVALPDAAWDGYHKKENELNAHLRSAGYESIKELENALGEKKKYKNQAEWIQKGIEMASADDPEFAEKSKYNKEHTLGFGINLGGAFSDVGIYLPDRERDVYAFINADEKERAEMMAFSKDQSDVHLYMNGYEYMTDQEVALYNYYYNTGGKKKASEYLNTILEDLGNRKALADFEKYEGKWLKELGFGVYAGLDQFATGMKNLGKSITGKEEYIPVNATQQMSGMIRQDLKRQGSDYTIIGDLDWGDIATTAYDFATTTSNMMPSILTSTLVGAVNPTAGAVVGAGLMGASASGNAYQEMLNLGYDKNQARTYAAIVGVSEAGLQYALGGIGKLGGVSGKLATAVRGIENGFAKFAIRYGGSFVAEGIEEGLQEVLNPLFMDLAAGYDTGEEINWEEVAYSALLGGLSGGLFGSVESLSSFRETKTNRAIGANIKANERIGEIFDMASISPEASSAYDTYTMLAKKGISAENVSDYQLGLLASDMQAGAQAILDNKKSTPEQIKQAEKVLEDLGVYAQANVGSRTGSAINFKKKALKDFDADDVNALIESGLESAEGTESHTLATEYKAKVESGKKLSTTEIAKLIDANNQAIKSEETSEVSQKLIEKGETPEVAELVARKMRGEMLTVEEAEKILDSKDAQIVIAESQNAENVTDELLGMAETIDKKHSGLFVALYDGKTDIEAYANHFNTVVAKAENGFGIDEVLMRHKNVLSGKQIGKIFAEVRIKADHMQRAKFQKLSQETASLKAYKGKIDDSIIDYNNTSAEGKINWNDPRISDRMRKAITFVKGFAQATGINLELITDGKERGYNGAFVVDDNKIILDIFAGIEPKLNKLLDTIIPTTSHELTHWMEKKSPVLYRKVSRIVFSTLQKEDGLTESERISNEIDNMLAKEYLKKYTAENEGKTISIDEAFKMIPDDVLKEAYNNSERIEEARSEIVARACEDMLSRSKIGREIFNSLSAKEQKTLTDKIKEIIQNIKDWINEVLGLYESASKEATIMRKYDAELDKLSELWDAMLKESVEVNQALEKSGAFGRGTTSGKILFEVRESINSDSKFIVETIRNNADVISSEDKFFVESDKVDESIRKSDYVYNIFKSQGEIAYNETIGSVELTYSGAKSTVFHGFGGIKLAATKAVKDVIEHGDIVSVTRNYNNSKTDRFVIAAKGKIDGSDSLVGVLVKSYPENKKSNAKFYLHEAIIIETDSPIMTAPQLSVDAVSESVSKDSIPNPDEKVKSENTTDSNSMQKKDETYLELAKDPVKNKAELEKMVEEAAREAMPNSQVVNGDGTPIEVYHQTANEFTVFDTRHEGAGTRDHETPFGIFMKSSPGNIGVKGEKQMALYANIENPMRALNREELVHKISQISSEYSELYKEHEALDREYQAKFDEARDEFRNYLIEWRKANPGASRSAAYDDAQFNEKFEAEEKVLEEWESKARELEIRTKEILTKALRDNGYDGVYIKEDVGSFGRKTDAWIALDNTQVKSADPVTYDDDGNIIPLSERFNSKKKDIRYQRRDSDTVTESRTYSYDELIAKPDMKLTNIAEVVPVNKTDNKAELRKNAVNKALENAKSVGITDNNGGISVYVTDMGRYVKMSRHGLEHGLDRRYSENLPATLKVGEIIQNAILINKFNPKLETAKYSYALIGAAKNSNGELSIVRFVVNEYSNELSSVEVLYSLNTKKESAVLNAPPVTKNTLRITDSTISIAQLLDYVNKYFPDILPESVLRHYGYDARPDGELGESALFQPRTTSSVYDTMGETERLQKENEKLRADVENLMEKLAMEKKVTGGAYFNTNQVGAAAGYIRNLAKSNIDKVELMKALRDFYSYITESDELAWEDVFGMASRIAADVLAESKPEVIGDEYASMILGEIRNTRISLTEAQKTEAQNRFGKNWNRYFFGRANITNDGISLESQWQEWAELYPDIFNADISDSEMVSELYDILGDLKKATETIAEYDNAEKTRWLATEIYNTFWNISPVRTTADKYDKKIKLLNFEHRKAMKELRDNYNERADKQKLADDMFYGRKLMEKDKSKAEAVAEQRAKDKERYGDIIARIREQRENDVAIAKAHGKEMLDKYKDNAERKTYIQRITSNALSLNELFVKNSKDKHIPDVMKPVVEELIRAIDFSSKRKLEGGMPTQKDVSLHRALGHFKDFILDGPQEVADVLDQMYGSGIDELTKELFKSVDTYMEEIDGKTFTINDMSSEDLKRLDTIVRIVKHSVNKVNQLHTAQYKAGVQELAMQSMEDIDSRAKIYEDGGKHFDKLKTHLYWNNITPYYAFKNLGEAAGHIFGALQDGQDKLAFLAKEIIDFTEKTYSSKDYKKWSGTFFAFEFLQPDGNTKKFKLNVPQIMSLYCVAKQEDALRHLLHGNENGEGGGITIVETKKTEAVNDNIQLTKEQLDDIIAKLDDRSAVGNAKDVADKLQNFMATRGAELGNEISMARWGIKSFGIENYFPIKVSDGTVSIKNDAPGVDSMSMLALLNMSFTHSRNEFAKQSIEIGDFFDVFANHMSDMARYNAMALPILDMYRWLNVKGKDFNGNQYSIETSVKNTYGKHSWNFFKTLLTDVSGGTKKSTRDRLAVKFFRNSKVAKVAGNLRVALLQFTSYFRAGAVIDSKYLRKAILHKSKIQHTKDHSGIALWKSMGYYDTDITRDLTEKIKHTETVRSKFIEWSLWGASKADELTWGYLWNACEIEVRDTRKDLEIGSPEFFKTVSDRLREVIYSTQVVDSMLTRSQMMRSPDGWDKVLTTFASENTLSFNMSMDIFVSHELDIRRISKQIDPATGKEYGTKKARKVAWKNNKKQIFRSITAFVITNAISAALQATFDAFRNYDDDDKEEGYFAKLFFTNFLFNLSWLNKIPYFNSFTSIIQGFTPTRVDTDWMNDLTKMGKEVYKLFSGEANAEKMIRYGLKTLSDVSGIAFYNLYRDLYAFYELFDED